jgi:hypothetical protein
MSPRSPLLLAVVAAGLSAASCSAQAVGDCSDGTFDGHGGCIPNSHAPRLVEAAAIRHFDGMTVDRVGCYVHRELRHARTIVRAWGCWRVADGILTHDLACVPAEAGHPLTAAERVGIAASRLRCNGA